MFILERVIIMLFSGQQVPVAESLGVMSGTTMSSNILCLFGMCAHALYTDTFQIDMESGRLGCL